LNYYQLKRWAQQAPAEADGKRGRVFVEMEGCGNAAGTACIVELEKGNGTRMRICVHAAVAVDWGKLKEAFLGA
jgi:hypothetical protein